MLPFRSLIVALVYVRRLNGGDEFYVRFENNETKVVSFGEVTDNDDGSYAVKFCTKVCHILLHHPDIVFVSRV